MKEHLLYYILETSRGFVLKIELLLTVLSNFGREASLADSTF